MKDHRGPTWRTPLFYRVFFTVLGLNFLGAGVWFFDGGSDLGFTALMVVLGVLMTAWPYRPLVQLRAEEVFARGVLFHRHIPLVDIRRVYGSYDGLVIETQDGASFTATSVGEKTNLAAWFGWRGKSDSMADLILDARDQALGHAEPQETRRRFRSRMTHDPVPVPRGMALIYGASWVLFLAGVAVMFLTDYDFLYGLALALAGALLPLPFMLQSKHQAGPTQD